MNGINEAKYVYFPGGFLHCGVANELAASGVSGKSSMHGIALQRGNLCQPDRHGYNNESSGLSWISV